MQCGGVQGFRGLVKQLLFLAYRVIFVASIIKVGAAAVARPGAVANGSVLCSRAELQTEDQSWISVFIDCIVRYLQVAIIYFLTCIDSDPLL